ncbi:hypothetical protein ACP2AV_01840 [Aliiroseovarius sp. PTFE2010]
MHSQPPPRSYHHDLGGADLQTGVFIGQGDVGGYGYLAVTHN